MRISKQYYQSIPWYLKPFFWNQKRKYGQFLEPAKIWAQVPRLFICIASSYGFLTRKSSPIPAIIRALVSIRVSQINGCKFCVDLNSLLLITRLKQKDKLQHIEHWQNSNCFSDAETAALHYAEQMSNNTAPVSDEAFDALKTYFSEAVIIELTALIAFQIMSSKFNSALGIEPQGLCKVATK